MLIVIISLVPLTAASAQETDPNEPTQDEVNAIAKQLYCPVCENVPLDVCGTQACAQWRELIREKLVEGWTEDEIKEYFSNQYGDRVLSEPPARGLNWLVYVIPPLIFLGGAFFLYRGFKVWKQLDDGEIDELETESDAEIDSEIDDEYMARMEEVLKNK